MSTSIIIPCYNEVENIPILIEKCNNIIEDNVEIILVNNGSTDNSLNIMRQLVKNSKHIKIVNVKKNTGYGHGILKGLEKSSGDILGWTHADLQTDINDIYTGLKFFESEKNIFVKGKRIQRPIKDTIFTIGMSLFEILLFRKLFWDINAQPNLFRRSFYETWQDPPNDFSLDLYVYYLAIKQKLNIKRFNVAFKQRLFGHSKWNFNWTSKMTFIIRTINFSINLLRNSRNDKNCS